jgi:hypothetical protein
MSNSNLIGQYGGMGAVPVGVILPWVSGYFTAGTNTGFTPVLASADTIAAANTYLNPFGYYVCDGSVLNITDSPIWNVAGRYLPNLTDSRFLMGATAIGATANGGSNVMADHKHANTNLTVASESSHTHGVGTFTNATEAAHTHGVGTFGNTAEAAHTHVWPTGGTAGKGYWSNDDATLYATASDNGDGSQNTYSDGIAGINAWGSGSYASRATGTVSADHTHSISSSGSHGHTIVCIGGSVSPHGGPGLGNTSPPQGTVSFTDAISGGGHTHTTNGISTNHTHDYYLPSHRHWIKARATTAGSSHNHVFSGTSASGSTHTHVFSGTSAAGSTHTHTLSGVIGSGSTDPVTGAIENRPKYMNCFMIIRVK